MKNEKLVEATMLALRGKLNEWEEAYEDDYGKGITTRWYEVETDDGFLDTHFEDENEAIKVARTYKGDVFVYVTGSEKYTTGDYRGYSEPLDSVLLWQRKDGEEQKFGNSNAILEAKGSSKTYTCIEDGQGGDFAVGKTMTAEEWGEEAYSWAYNDDWTDPEEPLLKNFKTEQECLDFIQDMWEITIVPSDSPEAKEFLGEARSHKEDNEKVAPRNKEQSFNGGPNKLSNKASGLAVGDKEKAETGISKALVGPEKGDIVGRDIKRNRVRSAEQALNRKNVGQLDFAGTTDMQDYEVSPNQKSREYRKAHGKITRESKKVTEAIDEKSLEISIDLKNKTYQEWFDEMKNKYGLVYQYTSILGPKDAPVGKIYVFKDSEDYNYAITNGREFNKLYDSGKLIIKGKKDIAKKTENNKLPNTKNLVDLEHKLSDLITNTDDTEVLDILQTMERLLSKYLLDKHISF